MNYIQLNSQQSKIFVVSLALFFSVTMIHPDHGDYGGGAMYIPTNAGG
jgi:hypothetical protein